MDDAEHVRALADAAEIYKWANDGTIWRRVLNGEVWMVRVEQHQASENSAA